MTKLAESESWANGWADQNIFNSRCVGPDCFIPRKKSLLKQVIVSYFFYMYQNIQQGKVRVKKYVV